MSALTDLQQAVRDMKDQSGATLQQAADTKQAVLDFIASHPQGASAPELQALQADLAPISADITGVQGHLTDINTAVATPPVVPNP